MLKSFNAPITFKADGEPGAFTAIFSTLNVIDKDQDVTVPGAFKHGQAVRIAQWGHDWMALPVGKGVIYADEQKAWVDGQFFLDTPHGQATYQTVKGLGDLQEWSYGFQIEQADFGEFNGETVRYLRALDVTEVSPVMVGAGVNTRTTDIKSMTFAEEVETALAAVSALRDRAKSLADLRQKEGRVLSTATRERLTPHPEAMRAIADDLQKLLDETAPAPKSATDRTAEARRLFIASRLAARFLAPAN